MKSSFKLHSPEASGGPMARRKVIHSAVAAALACSVPAAFAQSGKKRVTLNSVLPFDETTWTRLLEKGPRPAAYIFTTTYCSTCPDAFEKMLAFVMATRKMVELVVVLMDVQGARALEHARHYVGATRLYTFNGFEPAIRQSVDPAWPNVTPYIVLLGRDGSIQRSIGAPEESMLKKWLP